MKLPVVLAVLIGTLTLACSTAPAEPTPNIDATVEARLAQKLAARPTTMAMPAMPNQTNTPNPTFQVVGLISNTPGPPRAVPKEAMPNWATEDDCEVHFDLLLVCAHIVKTSSDLYHSGTFCGVSCVEFTLTNVSKQPLKYSSAKVDVYNLSNIKVTDGFVYTNGLPPKVTYQTEVAPVI